MHPLSVVILGGGVAGFSAAQELRARGYAGTLTIISPEGLPYDRPPLSKGYLLGTEDAAKILLAPESWYTEHGVDVVAARASVLDLSGDSPVVTLEDGARLSADRVLLATGALPRRLAIPGGERSVALRSRADADALRRVLVPGARIVVVGAGLIGAEVASAAAALGAEATLVDPVAIPLAPAVGEDLARRLHAMHAEHGVTSLVGAPAAIEDGTHDAAPHLVRLADGGAVAADAVVAGIGVTPDTALAEAAGLEVDDGVLVGPDGSTSHPAVFAAGDATRPRRQDGVVRGMHPTDGRRAEHWEAAVRSGQAAAAGILGEAAPEFGAPWFWSDRYGVHVEAVGAMDLRRAPGARTVLREAGGIPAAAFLLAEDGRLLGCAAIDQPLVVRAGRRIIDRGIIPDPDRLADPAVDPRRLAR
jgi:3-phenylpropionate/trans-cinnamate dioxygenase ferredoxin reductase subunit